TSRRRSADPAHDTAKQLANPAERNPLAANEAFGRALGIRQDIRRLAAALTDRKSRNETLRRLNVWLEELPPQPPVAMARRGHPDRLELPGSNLEEPLWSILRFFTALSTSNDASRVRRCEGEGCGYYFVDVTLDRSRRFCSSADAETATGLDAITS